jgi:hypothetical protein
MIVQVKTIDLGIGRQGPQDSLVTIAMKDDIHVRYNDHCEITGYSYGERDNMDNVITLAWKMVSTNDRDNHHCQNSSGFA